MEVTAKLVKELREKTGAGMMDCKKALVETGCDLDRSVDYLREKGLAAAAKRAGRKVSEGVVESYIHGVGRIGVLVEVNCETDFVAKTDEFRTLARDIAMQVAASRPEFVARDNVPVEMLEKEKGILRAQALNEGKPEKFIDKMVEGRLEKFFRENCLLEQPFIKNPEVTVQDVLKEAVARLGENIIINRFTRYELGERVTDQD
jgi:elongation factor Ts